MLLLKPRSIKNKAGSHEYEEGTGGCLVEHTLVIGCCSQRWFDWLMQDSLGRALKHQDLRITVLVAASEPGGVLLFAWWELQVRNLPLLGQVWGTAAPHRPVH